jgi:glycogen operon protein
MLTVQFFSRGVPMTLGGDEFARTQNGNNNPYKIDSIGVWQNFDMIATSAPTAAATLGSRAYHDNYGDDSNPTGKNGLFLFTKFLLDMRKAHPCLRQDRFGDFHLDKGDDVTYWFKGADGFSDLNWDDRCVHWRVDGSAIGDLDFLLCVNMWHDHVVFTIPQPYPGRRWLRVIDTAPWAEAQGNFWARNNASVIDSNYRVHPQSIAVFYEVRE